MILILTKDPQFERQAVLSTADRSTRVLRESADIVLNVLEEDVDLAILDADDEGLQALMRTVKIIAKCRPRIPLVVAMTDHSVLAGAEILNERIFYYMMKENDGVEQLREVVSRAIEKKLHLERI